MIKQKVIWELERRLTDNKRAKAKAKKDRDNFWQYYAGKVDAYEVAIEIVKEIEGG